MHSYTTIQQNRIILQKHTWYYTGCHPINMVFLGKIEIKPPPKKLQIPISLARGIPRRQNAKKRSWLPIPHRKKNGKQIKKKILYSSFFVQHANWRCAATPTSERCNVPFAKAAQLVPGKGTCFCFSEVAILWSVIAQHLKIEVLKDVNDPA